ncbi:hypothetical protein CHLRE_09g388578v5 [Chlamydomonas reinhardtii]|uniref:Triple QxxK/R motif-containing protein n=1 Tax=Chlamydomonas reinhardtii TaxID=3055 RepID=A0A2K3DDX9_CHLRE|nr:uncharacterized protein CHLRE_09g388578v5 [Chlamydomonas reinhardtii]PNW78740.1 hypothetical protein CHLRE_09g388578v5 [Chlamydomonas reinhardtii]
MAITGKGSKDQVTRGTAASADRKVKGDREKFETYKGEKRVANQARKAPRKQKSLAEDFPLGATGLYLSLLAFIAFVSAALYWVVVLSYPAN